MTWLILVILPLVLFLLGLPVFAALLTAATASLFFLVNIPPLALHQVMFGGVDKFALLAVPFFIFAGDLMARGGIAGRLTDWVLSLFGHVRGSLAVTTVATATLLGAVSGSSPATVAAVGRTMHSSLIKGGYGNRFSAGLIGSSGAIAIVIPPSIAMILYGASAEVSIPKLFLAGVVPGLILAAFMVVYITFWARRHGLGAGDRFSVDRVLATTRGAIGALMLPVIVLGGIYFGIFSPTEAGGYACLYALLLARFVYRSLTWTQILDSATGSAYLTAQVLIVVAAAGVFSWILTVIGIPQGLLNAIADMDLSTVQFLIAINLFLLLLGCVVDPTSAILVLTPILIPIIGLLGIDAVHFGIMMTVNLSIGMFTPPFGLNIFVVQSILPTDLLDIYAGLVPFFFVQVAALILITFVPGLSLFLAQAV
ncbi:MAG: TRAP transporter large permease [Alphaproteobacteria bacterium]